MVKEVERHYRTREAAAILSVSRRTLANWIASGDLSPVVAISPRDTRIPASVIQRFLDHRTIKRGASAL
jgi:excisionase family DNA binding protein